MNVKEADYYSMKDGKVICELCPRGCLISEGGCGFCRVRGVREGKLMALGYGQISSAHMDPIEKKPLNDFHPGSMIYSIGGWGCNLGCKFCQNWSISQEFHPAADAVDPAAVVKAAAASSSIGIAYTYNEPLISIEFLKDCAKLVREKGMLNVLVTNGYVEKGPAEDILPYIDALNIDVKSMNDDFYRQQCLGSLRPVQEFVELAFAQGCHVELTNLVIPGLNDSEDDIERLALWIKERLSRNVPLHLSAYRPMYKMDVDSTPVETLLRAREICARNLDKVYLGNVPPGYL